METTQNVGAAIPVKKKRSKGPIRFEAIVPIAIIVGVIVAYFVLFFDMHLRMGIEYGATYANGAEVNVARVRTSFVGASFEITGIQVTDPEKPKRNRAVIGRIHAKFLWDALLRAKFVTVSAGVDGIETNTERAREGRVLAREEREAYFEYRDKAKAFLEERYKGSSLANLVEFLQNVNPADAIRDLGNLKSVAKMAELERELGEKQKKWDETLASLPGEKQVEGLKARIKAVPTGGVSNPAELQKRIATVKDVIKDAETQVDQVKTQGAALAGEVKAFEKSVAEIEDVIAQDKRDLEARLKIPSLEPGDLAREFFQEPAAEQVAKVQHYTSMARKYMPPKSTEEKPRAIQPKPRSPGKVYQFGSPKAYPLFWLREATIDSKVGPGDARGEVAGRVLDATTDQALVGNPTVVEVTGNFPKQDVSGVKVKLTFDHREEIPVDVFSAEVGDYPVPERSFLTGDDLRFGIKTARGQSRLRAAVRGEEAIIEVKNVFKSPAYVVEGKSELLRSAVKDVTTRLPFLTLNLRAEGPWTGLKFGFDSNLGTALASAFRAQLQGRLAEAKAKVDRMLRERVGAKKEELTGRFNGLKKNTLGQVEAKRKQAEAVKGQALAKVEDLKKKALGGQKKIQDLGKQLKKKLPF